MYNYLYIIIFLILVYSSLYYIFIDEISIYQVSVEHFDFDLLYKRQPIVVSESIKDIDDILTNWFKYNIINYDIVKTNEWERNNHKYLVIYGSNPDLTETAEPIEVTICNPLAKEYNGVSGVPGVPGVPHVDSKMTTIKLKTNMVLIIPFRWKYHIVGNPEIHGVHDYITYCTSFFRRR
jgi:hypothetical protein